MEDIFRNILKTTGADPVIVFGDLLTYIISGFCLNEEKVAWKYKKDVNKLFFNMTIAWMERCSDEIEKEGWSDALGKFYEQNIINNGKQVNFQQYYTPKEVSSLAARILVTENTKVNTFNEPSCGSGRNLLCFARTHRDSYYVGEDVDSTSCRICICNFFIHRIQGLVICHNTLLGDPVHFAYATNPYIMDSTSPYYGITHILREYDDT